MTRKYFGTDGVRGKVGEFPITPEFVMRLGWAAGKVFARHGTGQILIGKDTRISGYMFESVLEAGLVAAGADVALLGPMPTPAIAYLTRTFSAKAGIVISASHNPFYDNGIKFFSAEGVKLPDEIEAEIEALLDGEMETVESSQLGKVVRIPDASGRYIEYCKSTVPAGFSLRGLRLVIDCAHGATYHIAPSVFRELGAEVIEQGTEPDGLNINQYVGSTEPASLQAAVKQHGADLGIAFDGDGDRVLFVDGKGELVDGDILLYIIARGRIHSGAQCSGVVGTLMSNLGFEQALGRHGIPFARSKVGDRYVIAEMQERDWLLGGESSGHIICADVTTTGDGIVAALQVLKACQNLDMSVAELHQEVEMFPQVMINVRCAGKPDIDNNADIAAAVAEVEAELGDSGRVLLRPSGTEPVVRVMVEGQDRNQVQTLVEKLSQRVEQALA